MKRHNSIVTLSREHHFGLLFCWKIRQGINKNVATERMQPYIKYFWDRHLLSHFQEEETLLFAGLKDALVEQAISEHRQITRLIDAVLCLESVQSDQLTLLADNLDNHIRFEERILFPHLEKVLPENKLTELGTHLQELHPGDEKDEYADEFWI